MIEPEIVYVESLEVLYVRKKGVYKMSAEQAWGSLLSFAYKQRIKNKKNLMSKNAVMIGIGYDDPSTVKAEDLRYDACISFDDKSIDLQENILSKIIHGGKYAVFLHKGSYDNLHLAYVIIREWIDKNGCRHSDDTPIFEKYLNRDPRRTKEQNLRTKIYVPIS